jgi:repressor LexA
MGITKKQKEVYDYICEYLNTQGYSPTQKEIKEHFEFKSFGSVQRYIKYLTDANYLETDWNARRGLRPPGQNPNGGPVVSHTEDIPLLGQVAAGIPIEAIENPETIAIPKHMVGGPYNYFALNVKGDSMIEDGIFEDDIIVCKSQEDANQGQTVVAIIEGEATVKRFHRQKNQIELHPANSTMSPILVNKESGDFRIAGVLVGLIRQYPG